MNPKVKVTYPSGVHKGIYEGYILQDMGKDALVMWSKDNKVNVVEKKIIEYHDEDLLVNMFKSIKEKNKTIETLQQTVAQLKDNLIDTTTELNEFKGYMEEYMKTERENRKALMAVIKQLKQNQHKYASPKKDDTDNGNLYL